MVLEQQLEAFRAMTYEALRARIGEVDAFEVTTPEGKNYQLEIQAMWDGKPDGNIRVLADIDDGGWSAFHPVRQDLVMTPAGTLL